jgi:hypothetical protein
MTDTVDTPVEPNSSAAGENWEARYKGLMPTVNNLTAEKRSLTEQLAAKTSECEQLRAQLTLKDTEKTVAVGERDKQLNDALVAKSQSDKELSELRALQLKVKVIKDMKRPDLLRIADSLPNLTDEEAMKTVFANFAGFADEAVQEREKQLLSGVTPPLSGRGAQSTAAVPTSEEGWRNYINALPLGSPERKKAMDDQWDWLMQANPKK